MPTSISGAVAGVGKEQCKHLVLAFSIDYKISIGSHSLSRKYLLFSSSFYWNENMIVYERFQLAGKLQQQSRGTPKEEKDSCRFFLYHAIGSQTNHPRTIRFNHGQVTPQLFHPRCCQRARWARSQHWEWKLQTSHWPTHDGVGKPVLWFAK